MPKNLMNDSEIFTLLLTLFLEWAHDNNMSTAELRQAKIADFYLYLATRRTTNVLWANKELYQERHEFDETTYEVVSTLIDRPLRLQATLLTMWPFLCSYCDETDKGADRVEVTLELKAGQGHVVYSQLFAPGHGNPPVLKLGAVCTLLQQWLNMCTHDLMARGFDGLQPTNNPSAAAVALTPVYVPFGCEP